MDNMIRKSVAEVVENNKSVVKIAVEQRAKFEGWLKFELADILKKIPGIKEVKLEPIIPGTNSKADLFVKKNNSSFFVELKTANSSWNIAGIAPACRPITMNIDSIIRDVKKLKEARAKGIMAFILFPVTDDQNQWIYHFNRISEHTGIPLKREKHCMELELTLSGKGRCKLVICAFKV